MVATIEPRTNPDWGLPGEHTSEGMRDLWASAALLDENLRTEEQRARGERWVPWRAIEIRHEILPRERREPDPETVERYAAIFDQLPAVTVQAGTLVLIDGLHREHAAPLAGRDHIRVIEREVPDDLLWVEAFRANVTHGRALTMTERRAMAERILRAYPQREEWPDTAIARLVMMERHAIARLREKLTARPITPESPAMHQSGTYTTLPNGSGDSAATPDDLAEAAIIARFDWDGEKPAPEADAPAPLPGFSPPAPVRPDTRKVTADYVAASTFFRTYDPAAFADRVTTGRPKFVATLDTWAAWIAACKAAVLAGEGD